VDGVGVGNPRVVAFLDIGTNSVRLLVSRVSPGGGSTTLTRQKEVVRLGEEEFAQGELQTDAMDRCVKVCRHLSALAMSFGVDEFVAVATSATREASNRHTLLSRIRHEAGVDVRVISGLEEARLIYLGVVSGVRLADGLSLIIDIGGGSTEMVLGDQHHYTTLSSHPLGSIRLTNQFFPGGTAAPVSRKKYRFLRDHVAGVLKDFEGEIRESDIVEVVGCSGTLINLAEIAVLMRRDAHDTSPVLATRREIRGVIAYLCSLPLEERRKVPGINPDRADIIIAGAAIIDVVLDMTGSSALTVTERGLQDGLLADYLSRMATLPLLSDTTVRKRTVSQLAHSYLINELHARSVTGLALSLFDSGSEAGLHQMGVWERELLEYATLLHDIGSFISYLDHQDHSWYIIRNSEMAGFDRTETEVIASLTRFHRRRPPRWRSVELAHIPKNLRKRVLALAVFLRLAESLDRSHAALVSRAAFFSMADGTFTLYVYTRSADCQLELAGVLKEASTFERIFQRGLVVQVTGEEG
jgi:exopolyphosphatase/guanosine-5'-triphosphate,3'-diphosphate pyrophosphatase